MPRRARARTRARGDEGLGFRTPPRDPRVTTHTHRPDTLHSIHTTPRIPTKTPRVAATEIFIFHPCVTSIPRSAHTRAPIERKKNNSACVIPNVHHTMTTHPKAVECSNRPNKHHVKKYTYPRPSTLSPGGAIDRDDPTAHDDDSTTTRRRDERSEPGVEGGETVHERWFIRHGRHVRDSAVGQCVIRRDAKNRVASRARDSNSIHSSGVRERARAVASGRDRGWRDASIGRERSDREVERTMDACDELRRMKDEKRNETKRERERERLT